jgi:hypothetical protein
MEMAIIKLCNPSLSADLASLERRISDLEKGGVKCQPSKLQVEEKPVIVEVEEEEIPLPEPPDELPPQPVKAKPSQDGVTEVENWNDIIYLIKQKQPLMGGVLAGSKAYIKGDYLLIDSKNQQFRSLVKGPDPTYKNCIRACAEEVLGVTYKLGPYNAPTNESSTDPLNLIAQRLKNFEV